jgi:hypothetical protein
MINCDAETLKQRSISENEGLATRTETLERPLSLSPFSFQESLSPIPAPNTQQAKKFQKNES